jgi:hydroxymethylpyrimidine/phosphomethylpyrimidine kinase
MPAAPPNVLAIAAADPTAGAGLQADILTLASLGCHPLSVLTAYTVQDTHGVAALHAVSAADVAAQARCVLADAHVLAIKIGVVASAANVQAIAELLAAHPQVPVVLDPVMASARGDTLGDEDTLRALRALLVPRATIATPNSLEARALGGAGAMLALGYDRQLSVRRLVVVDHRDGGFHCHRHFKSFHTHPAGFCRPAM